MATPFHFSKPITALYLVAGFFLFGFFAIYIEANILLNLLISGPVILIGILSLINNAKHSPTS
ncbi:hypothetical protein FLK61_38155 [Paenalkalicoccus suaedae]|uniref:Uncharacterized protein n=1 Tax=Paenalkalicoccus suaedae TaxID=2592382 RepID=A0A859FJ55_9BACI|nr:hypothetical protein [Paenalkalicoccus suaedae]QKS72455.1 hypothetical protein FLK61_38155 [Paenalkalicoccus suaedae]